MKSVITWFRNNRVLVSWLIPVIVLVVAIAFPYFIMKPKFWVPNIGIKTIWLGISAMSLTFLNRYLGLLSLAQVAVSAMSAYGIASAMVTFGLDWYIAIPIGLAVGTLLAAIIAIISIRTVAIYFLMITLAISQVIYSWVSQEVFVNGRRGLAPVRRPEFLLEMNNFYFFALAIAVFAYLACRYVASTPFGLSLEGIKDSPDRMRALGYSVSKYRFWAITFAGFIASLAGIIMVFDRAQADPDIVSLNSTLDVLIVAVLGGVTSIGGVFLGGLVFTLLDNFASDFTDRSMTLTGVIFVLILLFAPKGLTGVWEQLKGVFKKPSSSGAAKDLKTIAKEAVDTSSAKTKGKNQ
ncbi:MAG: branched-chain amino acid ABC transporter permease [Microbacteriaceae bacterium]|nr:branched-chain amino acid ABC transporter permease [Microbacteriaceae bacterium]